jgi:hypothetical protein
VKPVTITTRVYIPTNVKETKWKTFSKHFRMHTVKKIQMTHL